MDYARPSCTKIFQRHLRHLVWVRAYYFSNPSPVWVKNVTFLQFTEYFTSTVVQYQMGFPGGGGGI
jgi:hypothetical protein